MRFRVLRAKKRAKVLLFFDMTKFFSTFFVFFCIFLHISKKSCIFAADFMC